MITHAKHDKRKTISMIVFYGGDDKQFTLKQVSTMKQTKVKDLLQIAVKLFKIVDGLHNVGLVHGNLKMNSTVIRKNKVCYVCIINE